MPNAGDKIRASDVIDRCGVRLRRVANQSVNNTTSTDISWDTEDEDTDGFWSAGTTVTIPPSKGGIYAIAYFVNGAITDAGGTRHFLSIMPVSALVSLSTIGFRQPMHQAEDSGLVDAVAELAAGDTITFNVFHSTGVAVNFTAWMSCHRIAV